MLVLELNSRKIRTFTTTRNIVNYHFIEQNLIVLALNYVVTIINNVNCYHVIVF